MKIKKVKDIVPEIGFTTKSLQRDKDEKPSIKTSIEKQEKLEKEFKKEIEKIHKFEAFIDIHIDNIENLEIEYEGEDSNDEFDSEYEEGSGCGCCSKCTGLSDCDCGCNDCKCDELEDDYNLEPSEDLMYHILKGIPVTESIFRSGSKKFFSLIKEARKIFENGKAELLDIDKELFESTEIGKFAYYNGELVPLDLPMENIIEVNEAEYRGKKVKLNYPMRNSGEGKKYYVYVKNPKTGKVKVVHFGDVKGGLSAKIADPKARKSFVARHKCDRTWKPSDKLTASYWSCRLPQFKHLFPSSKVSARYW
ncbi:MAG: hypothetical protein EBU90_16415 [Proteobacteria bacterium]|nr:hypothetical protein [Pseudomonadota bacterium]